MKEYRAIELNVHQNDYAEILIQCVKIERRLIPTDGLPTCFPLYKYLSLA